MHGFPRTFGFEVFSTFTVLKMCAVGCSPKQTDRQWVGPGLQPNSDFLLMIWGSVHLPDGVPLTSTRDFGNAALRVHLFGVNADLSPIGLPQL